MAAVKPPHSHIERNGESVFALSFLFYGAGVGVGVGATSVAAWTRVSVK